jgi:DNA-binding response OmpR family regulator
MDQRRILVVSTDTDFVEPYAAFLRFAGYDVLATRDADEAIRVAASGRVDLVVIDFPTLASSGNSVTAEIRNGLHESVPILCVTSYVVGDELSRPYEAGATRVLPMPTTPRDLAQVVGDTLVSPA